MDELDEAIMRAEQFLEAARAYRKAKPSGLSGLNELVAQHSARGANRISIHIYDDTATSPNRGYHIQLRSYHTPDVKIRMVDETGMGNNLSEAIKELMLRMEGNDE